MENTETPQPFATQKDLQDLLQAGVLDTRAYTRALKLIGHTPNTSQWNRFVNVVLLVLGAGLTVCGIYFFFAYNWADMHRFVKLGIIETIIIALIFTAWKISLDTLPGKITLTVTGVLIGALLAVFGQIYQTGADSYRLFLGWSVLMAGWVFISRFTPMWFIWILLVNTTLLLYWDQVVVFGNTPLLMTYVFAINTMFVILWEKFSRKTDWLSSRWTPRLLALIVYYVVTIAAVEFLLGESNGDPYISTLAFFFLVINTVTLYVYSQKTFDLFMLTISIISIMVVFDTWFADLTEVVLNDFTPLVIGLIIIAQTAGMVTILLRTSKAWEARQS